MRDRLTAMDALPGQFITTNSGAVMEVIEHRGGVTYLRTTQEMQVAYGVIPTGSPDSIMSHAPIKAISDKP